MIKECVKYLKSDDVLFYESGVTKEGVEYTWTVPKGLRTISKVSSSVQWLLWKIGIPIHNPIRKECTPDFNCCKGKKFGYFPE